MDSRVRLPSLSHVALATPLLALACGPATPHPTAATVTDSAGVRIVEYAAPDAWPAPASAHELLRIGAVEGPPELLFSRIPAGVLLDDGSIVLADAGSRELRHFAADGSLLGVQGGTGQGPGEFEFIVGSGKCSAEGFAVFDIGWSANLYDESGSFLEKRASRLEGGVQPYLLACGRRGRVASIGWSIPDGGPPQGFHVATAALRLYEPDGALALDLGKRISSERFGQPSGSGPHPIGRSTKVAFVDSDLIVSDGTFFGFERWSSEGVLSEIVRVDVPLPDADSAMALYLETALARAPDDETRIRWQKDIEGMGLPPRPSYLSDLFVTDEILLLKELSIRGSGRWFEFVAEAGFRLAAIPSEAKLLDVRGDRILVEERDSLGVPMAVLYSRSP
ncbi:MAG: hypothetical protein R3E10_19410 [Gemmatimonadota bacterium]